MATRWLTFDCFGTLVDWRHGIGTAEDVSAYKPDHAHFARFESVFGGSADAWIHVAQSYYHDILPSAALGIRRIWVNRQGEKDDPTLADAVVRGLANLQDAIKRMPVAT